ncbi:phosphatase PAP2 family protein [Limibacter armeniacum]|uniref:phosphatase PAP2 family protein n=1 Tax=Limibacter armeniacum TaxID=466084 RepID=UPI002FE5FE57
MSIKQTLRNILAVILLLAPVLILLPKGAIVLYLNQLHTPVLDYFFKHITYLGDAFIILLLIPILLIWRYQYLIACLFTTVICTLIVNLGKRVLGHDMLRPVPFFNGSEPLHFVDGIDIHSKMSFPSGHTATAFACAMLLTLIWKSRSASINLFTLAILVGCSRMYLLQHFYMDVFAGVITGMLSAMIGYHFSTKVLHSESGLKNLIIKRLPNTDRKERQLPVPQV